MRKSTVPIIFVAVVFTLCALFLYLTFQSQIRSSRVIRHVKSVEIFDREGRTKISADMPIEWQELPFRDIDENGAFAVYGSGIVNLTFLKRAAEDWDTGIAVKSLQDALDEQGTCLWYSEPVQITLGSEQCLAFSYCDSGSGLDKMGNEHQIPLYHIVLTVVRNKMIYRVVLSCMTEHPISKENLESKYLFEGFLDLLKNIRFSDYAFEDSISA